jgi:5,10-methylenetetrahydromethanopterin reductase
MSPMREVKAATSCEWTVAAPVGCYLLPGTLADPLAALDEAELAESLGLSTVWISEKFGLKDLPALAGAVAATTTTVGIGAGITHIGFRHPLAIASMGHTLQVLSGGRFRLGFGRAAPPKWSSAGLPQPTGAALADMAGILRRLWSGARVSYDGPAGHYPALRIDTLPGLPPPALLMAAIGPKSLAVAARHFDGVILHPFLTPRAVAAAVKAVRAARDAAGLSQEGFTVLGAIVVGSDAERSCQLQLAQARAARYFGAPTLARALMEANGWDEASLAGTAGTATPGRAPARTLPPDWIEASSALGDGGEAAARLAEYVEAGLDELILHGGTIHELRNVARAAGRHADGR